MNDGDSEREITLVNSSSRTLGLEMQLDITILTGCDSSLKGKRDLRIYICWLCRGQIRRCGGVHVGRVELGNDHGVGPSRVCNAPPEDAILEPGPGIDGCEPVEGLVPLLVGIAITPVDDLLGRDSLFPYKGEVASSGSCLY